MKFPESWLRDHVQVAASRDELVARLTAIGLEVEDVIELGAQLDGVVVGEILACERHPEAERLQVCRVATGGGAEVQIVCGAPNARPGLKAPLATIGAQLPGGIAIKAATLRGVDSRGMLCSAKELGIDADASGLMELPPDAAVGMALADYLGLPDATIELKLTPNRADCFSVRGIAFDAAAAFGGAVRTLEIAPILAGSESALDVALDAGADCPRYCGRVIDGLSAGAATPLWMRERLKRAGLRSISLLVDVGNYVMLELGQPMHAFDRAAIRGAISVRRARDGETLKLLDERDVTLDEQCLVIADAERPLALAGIMGGWDSRVTDATCSVFLESAHFAPAAIVGRGRKFGLHTDAAHRFERGVDPTLPRQALEYATRLIMDAAGGVAGPVLEAALHEHLQAPRPVHLRRLRLERVLGLAIGEAEVERIFVALGMQVARAHDGWRVTPPSRRFDIAIEEDLIEEVARIHGYDRVPTAMPCGEIRIHVLSEARVPEADLRRALATRDYREAIDYAFVDAELLRIWGLADGTVALANPLSSELGAMRPALLPGLVQSLRKNCARQQTRVRLFELGRVFAPAPNAVDAPLETQRIAAVACGPARGEQWSGARREVDFYDLKADLENLAALAGDSASLAFEVADVAWLHPGRSARVLRDGRPMGWLGHLHPRLVHALGLDGEVVAFELDVAPLTARRIAYAVEPSRYPSVRRDLAVVVPESTAWASLEASLRAALGTQLRDVQVFDQYVGTGLDPGFKSLAMGLILQDVSRTLTDSDADQAIALALGALARDCSAKQRG